MKLTKQIALKFASCVFEKRNKRPLEVQIELTNRCNFDCPMCPRSDMNAPFEDMSEETFTQVLSGIKGVGEVILTGWGEPLVHPKFFEFVNMIKGVDPKTVVRFTTNGCLLNDKRIGRVLETGIDAVTISLDSLNDEPGTGHPKASTVIENIKRLLAARGGKGKPEVVLQATINKDGGKDLEGLLKFCSDQGVDRLNLVRLITVYSKDLERPDQEEEGIMIANLRALAGKLGTEISSINVQDLALRLMTHNDRLCIKTVYHAYITVDGQVTPCCNMRDFSMGNILETPLTQIWTGDKFKDFYRDQEKLCQGCDQMKLRQNILPEGK